MVQLAIQRTIVFVVVTVTLFVPLNYIVTTLKRNSEREIEMSSTVLAGPMALGMGSALSIVWNPAVLSSLGSLGFSADLTLLVVALVLTGALVFCFTTVSVYLYIHPAIER